MSEHIRQLARRERKMAVLERAATMVKEGKSRLEALQQAVTEHRNKQNDKYSESGRNV